MMTFTDPASVPSDPLTPFTDRLRLAVAAYLDRFKGSSREHTESDLRCYLSWCAERSPDPLAAQRAHLELCIRWMQQIRRFKPPTVSRRFSVRAGFYRTCALDGVLPHTPAEHVRRPSVPAESPTLGFTHLQFEALLTAARESANPADFALVAMLGLLGLRIFEAASADIADPGKEHGHRVLRVCGKGTKVVLVPLPPAAGRAIDRQPDLARADRSCSTVVAPGWTGTRPPAACDNRKQQDQCCSDAEEPVRGRLVGHSLSTWRHGGMRRMARPQRSTDRCRRLDLADGGLVP